MKNRDKEWKHIVEELLAAGREVAAWDYVTALRGPDVPCKWPTKVVFTGPLRCKSMRQVVANATDFKRLSPESMIEALRFVREHRQELLHYLVHTESAWRTLHRRVSFLLRGLISLEPLEDLESWAKEYKKLVDEWLSRENAIDTGGQSD